MIPRRVLRRLKRRFHPRACDSAVFIYDELESQSGGCLPLIYQPFDPDDAAHFSDRGHALDFTLSAGGERILDFGPGDGWPSLIIAGRVESVTGVDASARRVRTCSANARRLGIGNATFVHVPAGAALPFPDGSFDGAVAASSVEQSPDPLASLREICRVLKPGGRLRLLYESLEDYRGGLEQAVSLLEAGHGSSMLLVYDRRADKQYADQYRLSLSLNSDALREMFAAQGIRLENAWRSGPPPAGTAQLNAALLEELAQHVTQAVVCRTFHPNGRAFKRLLLKAGFADVLASCSGGDFARRMFAGLDPAARPRTLEDVDELLAAPVAAAISLRAPLKDNPPLTAIKAAAEQSYRAGQIRTGDPLLPKQVR